MARTSLVRVSRTSAEAFSAWFRCSSSSRTTLSMSRARSYALAASAYSRAASFACHITRGRTHNIDTT